MANPLVTVVTPCFNSADTIERTIESVFAQTYQNIEHIVMDGASIDGTAEIARRYEPRLTVISEPDNGQSDAINKGWRMARGDILAWLNADDQYFPDTVEQAVSYFLSHREANWIYGSVVSVDKHGREFPTRPYRRTPLAWDYDRLLTNENYVPQPSVFLRRHVIEDMGYLNEELHYCMDREYWLRVGAKYPGHPVAGVRTQIINSREMKTERGGIARLQEIEAMVACYGMTGLPRNYHHQWTVAAIENVFSSLRQGNLRATLDNFNLMRRYPRTIPHGVLKATMKNLVPDSIEQRLRKILVRPV